MFANLNINFKFNKFILLYYKCTEHWQIYFKVKTVFSDNFSK